MAFGGNKRIEKASVSQRTQIILDMTRNKLTHSSASYRGGYMKKVSFYNKQGERLVGALHVPNKTPAPAIIISHGFGSSKDNKEKWAETLQKAGFTTLRFDFSGHGESQGLIAETTLTKVTNDLKSAVSFVKDLGYNKVGLTGHSLGGAASLLAASKAHAVVPIAPPTHFGLMYDSRRKEGLVNLDEWREKGYTNLFGIKVNYSLYSDAVKYHPKSIAKTIKCPVMIIHGDKDEIVPLQHSIDFFNALACEKSLEIIKGARHNFVSREYRKMIKLTKEWFTKWL